MDEPCTSGMNDPTSASTSTCSPISSSKIPVRTYKRKRGVCPFASKVKRRKLVPREVIEPIVHIPDDEMCPEEPVVDIVPQCSQVQDIRTLYARFQEFNTKMVSLNESLYLQLGLYETYAQIEKQLMGFLGELHYYREKEDALKKYNTRLE